MPFASHLVGIGAIVVIVSSLSAPFIQNLIHYDNIQVVDATTPAFLSRSITFRSRGSHPVIYEGILALYAGNPYPTVPPLPPCTPVTATYPKGASYRARMQL